MNYYLTILNYTTGVVHIEKISTLQMPTSEQIEDMIEKKGMTVSEVEWMLGTKLEINI